MRVNQCDKVFALYGHPVAHSVSPLMHNAAFRELGLNCCYLAFDVMAEDLEAAVKAIRALGLGGVNITVPHKEKVLSSLDELDRQADLIGAVNTIVNRDDRLTGYNTDAGGFLESLRADAGFDPKGSRAMILGAGGAARAVAYALALGGVKSLGIYNRNPFRAETLAEEVSRATGCELEAGGLKESELMNALSRANLLINATSAGMHPHTEEMPLPDPSLLHRELTVYDLVYNPAKTRLLSEAEVRGCRVCNGIGMLVYQGALAFELWTGIKPPVPVMRMAVEGALRTGSEERV